MSSSTEKWKKYYKEYCEKNKEKLKQYHKEYYEKNKERILKYQKQYWTSYRKKCKEKRRERYKEESKPLINKINVSRYFKKKFSRFITLENYLTIMKMPNENSKRSIMTRLGQESIDQYEAVKLSCMTFTEDDYKEMMNVLQSVKKEYNVKDNKQ